MKLHLFSILAGLAFAGSAYAQAIPLPPPPPPPVDNGTIIGTNSVQNGSARIVFLNDLQFGMSGSEVFELQYVLQAKGYLSVGQTLTGYFGAITRSAVMAYQRARGISATGFVGPLTRAALNGGGSATQDPTTITIDLSVGSSGGQVRLLQNKLLAAGYFSGEVTGYFGLKTRAAVVLFQQTQGISPTGYVGPLTRAALNATVINPGDDEQVTMREGQREGPFLLQKIYADYVTGLNFAEYPIAMEQGNPVSLRIGEIVSNGCTITLTLVRIEGTSAVFLKKVDSAKICPICLPGNALIDTPNGPVSVSNITEGMLVWTRDTNGTRVSTPVLKTSKVSVPETHITVSLKLDDGRVLQVSPGHPTADGRIAGNLAIGDVLDGSRITSAERITYREGFTYDILPAGATGTYWADSILIGSTLR